jgi:hypothetical protein
MEDEQDYFIKQAEEFIQGNTVVKPDSKIYCHFIVQEVFSFFNETSYAPEAIFIAFFEGFTFSVCLDTVGYFLHIFELNLTGVFCIHELICNSVIPGTFLGSLHKVVRRPLPVT